MNRKNLLIIFCICGVICCAGCSTFFGNTPIKQYYVLNYVPASAIDTRNFKPYPVTIRVREFNIEEAYSRPQIVYRQSPFELRYYSYKLWAVKPSRMITDLVCKHIAASNLVSHVVMRYDEGNSPDYEMSGTIEALEEYDSDQLWFAHLALRISLTRISDGATVYSRQFDNRKKVFKYSPEAVVQELSSILEFIMNQVTGDVNDILANGKISVPADSEETGSVKGE